MHNGIEYADKSLKEALLAFSQGKKVLVLTEYDDGSMNIDNMEKYFTEIQRFSWKFQQLKIQSLPKHWRIW